MFESLSTRESGRNHVEYVRIEPKENPISEGLYVYDVCGASYGLFKLLLFTPWDPNGHLPKLVERWGRIGVQTLWQDAKLQIFGTTTKESIS